MEDKKDWLVLLCALLLFDVLLVFLQQLRMELDVAGLVDTVNIAEASSDAEVW